MVDLPTIEQVLEAIDDLSADWTQPAGPNAGLKFVSWRSLAFALFPAGSPAWVRPEGKPHGLDRSPAFNLLDGLGADPAILKVRLNGTEYFARRP